MQSSIVIYFLKQKQNIFFKYSATLQLRSFLIQLWALVYYKGPIFLADFEIIPIEAVRCQILWGDGSRGLGAEPPVR
jgi:hypothetical protein